MTGATVRITEESAPFVAQASRRRFCAAWRPRKPPAGRRRYKCTACFA